MIANRSLIGSSRVDIWTLKLSYSRLVYDEGITWKIFKVVGTSPLDIAFYKHIYLLGPIHNVASIGSAATEFILVKQKGTVEALR